MFQAGECTSEERLVEKERSHTEIEEDKRKILKIKVRKARDRSIKEDRRFAKMRQNYSIYLVKEEI